MKSGVTDRKREMQIDSKEVDEVMVSKSKKGQKK